MKKVKCIETGITYNSAREAGTSLNISYKTISKCINGKAKSAGGYHFVAILDGDILPQATNQISDISNQKVASNEKSPTQKVANEGISDILDTEKSPQEKVSDTKKSPNEKSLATNEKVNTEGNSSHNYDWFEEELRNAMAAEKSATKTSTVNTIKYDTELIESIIIPSTEGVKPLIDKEKLIKKWEREDIERRFDKYITFPISPELEEQLIIAFYDYVKWYNTSYIDTIESFRYLNKKLESHNQELINELSKNQSEKEALERLNKQFDNLVAAQNKGEYLEELLIKERKYTKEKYEENHTLKHKVEILEKKLYDASFANFTDSYERDCLLKKVTELEEQLKVANEQKSLSDKSDVQKSLSDILNQKVANEDDTQRKKSPSEDSRTFDRPSPTNSQLSDDDSQLSDEGRIISPIECINSKEEIQTIKEMSWEDI